MPRYPTAKRDQIFAETRQRILDSALSEFARYGFESANVERIALNAGFAKGTVYNHFASKRDLIEQLIDQVADLHCDFIRERVLAQNDPIQRLRAFYMAGFDFVQQFLPQARLALATLNSPDHGLNERLYQAYQPLFSLLAQEILLPGARQGSFSDQLPFSTVGLLMSLYLGAAASIAPGGRPYQDPAQAAEFALAALRRE